MSKLTDADLIRRAMAALGRRKSDKKAAACRANGKKGGAGKHKPKASDSDKSPLIHT